MTTIPMPIPTLPLRTFTDAELMTRRKSIGASEAHYITEGKWRDLFDLKTGETTLDLSDELAPQLGLWTEAFNLAWCQKRTGWIMGSSLNHGIQHGMLTATPDAITVIDGQGALVNAKHTNQFSTPEQLYERYAPQAHHEMLVTGHRKFFLSVIFGNAKWDLIEIKWDQAFADHYLTLVTMFWNTYILQNRAPEMDMEPVAAPVPPEKWRAVDMTGNNAWADAAALWADNLDASKIFKSAEKSLKSMVEADVGKASGHGVEITRSKDNKLSIKKAGAAKSKKKAA